MIIDLKKYHIKKCLDMYIYICGLMMVDDEIIINIA